MKTLSLSTQYQTSIIMTKILIAIFLGGGTGSGTAIDVDADGQLIVRTDSGEVKVFTGEVSVHGIYGAV